jgi:hypothetical protein
VHLTLTDCTKIMLTLTFVNILHRKIYSALSKCVSWNVALLAGLNFSNLNQKSTVAILRKTSKVNNIDIKNHHSLYSLWYCAMFFFYICLYWFQPALCHQGIPRCIYRDVYSGLITEMFTVYPILPLIHWVQVSIWSVL